MRQLFYAIVLSSFFGSRATGENINSVADDFPETIYSCFFSIKEFRSISCKEMGVHDDYPVTTPDQFSERLTVADKKKLLHAIDIYVYGKSKEATDSILRRTRYWCIGRMQYEVIRKYENYSLEFFIDILYNLKKFPGVFSVIEKGQTVASLSLSQMDYVFFETLNVVSAWTFDEQKKYYSLLVKTSKF